MANQKVKHIIAKLVGQSTESTLDVYDVDAVHTDKIANNLTTTSSGYVLDARQGKALNDSLTTIDSRTLHGTANALTGTWTLNSMTTAGVYRFTAKPTDAPSWWLTATFGVLIVTKNNNYAMQMIYTPSNSSGNNKAVLRFNNTDNPSTWMEFPFASN